MFMRLRGHTCTYCQTIEEAHYKRHIGIAEKIRGLYESCGEVEWTIIPSEPYDRGRTTEPGDCQIANKSSDSDPSNTSEDTPTSKRERKDAKSLARAASRSRVINQDEIQYVDSVLHMADGSNDSEGPRNPEEIEEIEKHLRYHAQVYNTQPDRRGLRKLAQFPDADVDFDAEMERVLEIFRITQLVKRNTRNRGLQGRDMKNFEALVEEFKCAVVEDIVLVKKDMLEVRMRRAGYMRYTNRTAVTRVEDRYVDKDWRTGERLTSSASDSSGSNTPLEEVNSKYRIDNVPSTPQQLPPSRGPDRRHLETIHMRVTGEDGLPGAVIEPYSAPLLNLRPDPTPTRKPFALKVVISDGRDKGNSPHTHGSGRNRKTPPACNGWQNIASGLKTTLPLTAPSSSALPAKISIGAELSQRVPGTRSSTAFHGLPYNVEREEALSTKTAPSVQAAANETISSSRAPEEFVSHASQPVADASPTHPVVSQKKKAKKEREAKRKAKKLAIQEEPLDDSPGFDGTSVSPLPLGLDIKENPCIESSMEPDSMNKRHKHTEAAAACTTQDNADVDKTEMADLEPTSLEPDEDVSSTAMPTTDHGKHLHWHRFTRNLIVDQLTPPSMIHWHTPPNGSPENAAPCAFERHDKPDCPFHDSFFDPESTCACCAYRKDICHLTYPGVDECSFGPLDRLHCERLLRMYENDSKTQGRLMLVDDVLLDYLLLTSSSQFGVHVTDTMPKALAREYTELFDKCKGPGPLIQQERLYQRLATKNRVLKHKVSSQQLHKMQLTFEPKDGTYTCYCHTQVVSGSKPEDTIVCSHRDCTNLFFHRACVKQRHLDNVSRWYCTTCADEMKELARDILLASGDCDDDGEELPCEIRDQLFKYMRDIPDNVFERVKSRVVAMKGVKI
ncbi:hypothetical protein T440DRAFT_460233 [Plenodomus tracheiphilus IPT5]|uniref:PHD-type domain-containing protein n=1 Tax=Plenodomus tracheiphilus IPT5 TaxID=1408161 RepID=A0A6A7AQ82_9PLEO|nr:hypothetical protein T440DRAFT_460233 [Plenodomus tracheiphilus IPT5]